jgi:hypothetical protein
VRLVASRAIEAEDVDPNTLADTALAATGT